MIFYTLKESPWRVSKGMKKKIHKKKTHWKCINNFNIFPLSQLKSSLKCVSYYLSTSGFMCNDNFIKFNLDIISEMVKKSLTILIMSTMKLT